MSPYMPIFFTHILSAGAVAVRVRKKRLGAGVRTTTTVKCCVRLQPTFITVSNISRYIVLSTELFLYLFFIIFHMKVHLKVPKKWYSSNFMSKHTTYISNQISMENLVCSIYYLQHFQLTKLVNFRCLSCSSIISQNSWCIESHYRVEKIHSIIWTQHTGLVRVPHLSKTIMDSLRTLFTGEI